MKDDLGHKILCGKCGDGMLYHDYVPGTGEAGIACMKCGNRQGEAYGFKIEGEDKEMATKGKCINCKRDDVAKSKTGAMCYSCEAYVAGTSHNPELRAKKLAEAATIYGKLKPGEKLPPGRRKQAISVKQTRGVSPLASALETMRKIKTYVPDQQAQKDLKSDSLTIVLSFCNDERPLFDSLITLAKEQRREPEQQAMWMLQQELERKVFSPAI